jgi:hypothetical protein
VRHCAFAFPIASLKSVAIGHLQTSVGRLHRDRDMRDIFSFAVTSLTYEVMNKYKQYAARPLKDPQDP